jgi:hypothetical protein
VKYHIYPESKDGIEMPFTPEPLDLREAFKHLALRIELYEQQGNFTNANMERIPVSELAFRLVPASEDNRRQANGWTAKTLGHSDIADE